MGSIIGYLLHYLWIQTMKCVYSICQWIFQLIYHLVINILLFTFMEFVKLIRFVYEKLKRAIVHCVVAVINAYNSIRKH